MKYNILIVYGYRDYPVRSTSWNHLYAYRNNLKHNCYYLNLAVNTFPLSLRLVKFDLVIFDTLFFVRFKRPYFEGLMRRASFLKKSAAVKIMLPQDEFINTDLLSRFAGEFNINHIFSVAPESEWEKIYAGVDRSKTSINRVLTGYLDDETVRRIELLDKVDRDIDVGYCAADPPYWHGRHGMLKGKIGEVFLTSDLTNGLTMNITTPKGHPFLGDDWYRFLLRCRYTLGVEGGTSVLDRDGTIMACTERYCKDFPDSGFEEVEASCFPGHDGNFKLFAASPRHLEACVTRTCQVLVEGDYNGILKPAIHYIPLKKDFSNLAEVVESIKDEEARKAMVERAYRDIVATGDYSYRKFAEAIVMKVMGSRPPRAGSTPILRALLDLHRLLDSFSWVKVRMFCIVKNFVKRYLTFCRPN